MISRRTLLKALTFVGLGGVFSEYSVAQKNAETDARPPQTEALLLVWSSQEAKIKELEQDFAVAELKKEKRKVSPEGRWWFDTDLRRWDVQRPFEPGGIDSTHRFDVTYFINDKDVGHWFVDTRNKKVSMDKPAR